MVAEDEPDAGEVGWMRSCQVERVYWRARSADTVTYYLVRSWGRDRYQQATATSVHDTIDDAYARLDAVAETLQRHGGSPDRLDLHVEDAEHRPVMRPAVCPSSSAP